MKEAAQVAMGGDALVGDELVKKSGVSGEILNDSEQAKHKLPQDPQIAVHGRVAVEPCPSTVSWPL